MNDLTWLGLYDFLCRKANDIKNLDPSFWSQRVSLKDHFDEDRFLELTYVVDEEGKKKVTFSEY